MLPAGCLDLLWLGLELCVAAGALVAQVLLSGVALALPVSGIQAARGGPRATGELEGCRGEKAALAEQLKNKEKRMLLLLQKTSAPSPARPSRRSSASGSCPTRAAAYDLTAQFMFKRPGNGMRMQLYESVRRQQNAVPAD
ncbi:hypothetical protein WOLCODRAFT_154158 [Wolfiporia cocos MD-104 SS10]|uniref:Uncharacterized protein n=1 Tax=Wolfiporia cocos (strain MD-104) TaxID=742152 RepID=A0A2H3JVV7_WOLCO|nr:hypothetical protein WOLCODRAFT_154158 [Wolfiporia cocos MD-104 SS10]